MIKLKLFSLLFGSGRKGKKESIDKTIEDSRKRRSAAESKIDGMVAQLNGCGDRWFLQPIKTLDECGPDKLNGET